ncbi:MAG: aminotransferase class I/II-fold pyridoxal phosphate-dependent enzyme [Thomasclavelia sp.]|nr:aminotransferase class I/II-fold pyridoxal phosphate-dependent enzyme [Thomasclavelia sp.]
MNLKHFAVEAWMTEHENTCKYNLGDTCTKCLTLEELLILDGSKNEVINKLLNTTLDYGPIVGSESLLKEIIKLYKKGDITNITTTHGCINANELVLTEVLNSNDHIVSITPTYEQLFNLPDSYGVECSVIPLNEKDWSLDMLAIKNSIKSNTKMICLDNPNNPTGKILSQQEVDELIKIASENNLYLFFDEAYRGLNNEYSISDLYDKGICSGSLSKLYSCPGIRIGWIKGPQDIIKRINNRRDYTIISSGFINDYLGTIVLRNKDKLIKRSKDITKKNKEFLLEWLKSNPHFSIECENLSSIGFLHYDFNVKSIDFCDWLQEKTGVMFVPGSCFNKEGYLRFGFGNDNEVVKTGLNLVTQFVKDELNL